jgi:glycosyltransferase involved in cell wall biosynthesis
MAGISGLQLTFFVADFPPSIDGGSGRSNATLVSAIAPHVRGVTVLHRSPSTRAAFEYRHGALHELAPDAVAWRDTGLIHVSGRVDPELVGRMRDELGIQMIYTSRSNARALDRLGTRPHSSARNSMQDTLMAMADRIVACSRAAAAELREDYPVYADKICAIHNALDPLLVQQLDYLSDERPVSEPVIGYVGRMRAHKGLADLLAVCERLWERGLAFRLMVLGGHDHGIEPTLGAAVVETCRRWRSRITSHEWTNDPREVARAYLSSHCIVVPSYVEPFGLVALEALAAGCYLIASDVGGLPEIVADVPRVLVYPCGDLGRLEAHLSNFITSGRWRDMPTPRGARSVRKRFSVDQMAESYRNLYCNLHDR